VNNTTKGTAVPKVRTTMNPLDEIDVSPSEYADLRASGLLLDTRATTDDGLLKAASDASAERPHPAKPDGAGVDYVPQVADPATRDEITDNENTEG